MEIRLLTRDEIEPAKWNGCVHYSLNSRIYGHTWYLDNVCDDWMGLVEDDYQSVMPLVWNNKLLGMKRLYQPYLCQQLGLFSMHVCSKTRMQQFLNAIPNDIRYIDIFLNAGNTVRDPDGYTMTERPNYVLDLMPNYENLRQQYSDNLKRNLKKAEKSKLFCTTDLKPEAFVEAVRQSHLDKKTPVPEAIYHAALRIIYNSFHRGLGVIYSALNEQKELCAATFVLFDGRRMINLLNVSTEKGRDNGAMAFIFDMLIRNNSGSVKMLDFEGSSIEGIARFYQSFGAQNEPYFQLRANRLPWWLKLFKK